MIAMWGAAIIVLRETIEAALLVGIVAAATAAIPGRSRWIAGGIAAGAAGAMLVAALAQHIGNLFHGMGQELFNATVCAVAVVMLGWHNVWMSAHGAELAAGARRVGREVAEGRQELTAVFIVIALAVLREGSEAVLFIYGLTSGEAGSAWSTTAGAAVGLGGGALLGFLLYKGMLRIPMKHFFSVTSALILLLAAGMAARTAAFLVQADILPSLKDPVWDTSSLLREDSPLGVFLHALIGYDVRPSAMQLVFYVAAFAVILAGMWKVRRLHRR
jgi:high-affinity iron transporter